MRKLAFLIGIDQYAGDAAGNTTKGCVNDVHKTSQGLIKFFGFLPEDIRLLTNSRATKREIWSRLTDYVGLLEPGDTFVIQVSSLGTRYSGRCTTGDVYPMQDVLVAHDFTWDDPVLDGPSIGGLLSSVVTGVTVVLILDTCHTPAPVDSAPKYKLAPGATPPKAGFTAVPGFGILSRYLAPPVDIAHRQLAGCKKPRLSNLVSAPILVLATDGKTGATEDFIEGAFRGAFTWAFWKAIEDLEGQPSYLDVFTRTQEVLHNLGYPQVPLILAGTEATSPILGGKNNPRHVHYFEETYLNPNIPQGGFFQGYGTEGNE